MKKLSLIVASILLTATATTASAQTSFEGYFGQVGAGYSSLNSSTSGPADSFSSSAKGANGSFAGGYTWSVAPKFTVALGVDYQPIAGSSSTGSLTTSGPVASSPAPLVGPSNGGGPAPAAPTPTSKQLTSTSQQTSAYAIYVAPGFVIDDQSLVYAKLGYAGTQMKTSLSGGSAQSASFNGYLAGIGYKRIISGGLYGFIETNYTTYGSQTQNASGNLSSTAYSMSTTTKLSSLNTMIGVGYTF